MLIQTQRYDVDQVAKSLIGWSSFARSMPPSWDGCRDVLPLLAPDGAFIGRLLPGRGLFIEESLKSLGIHRTLPAVFERSLFERIYAKLLNERGSIASHANLINAYNTNRPHFMHVSKTFTHTINKWHSLFESASGYPGTGGTYSNIPGGSAMDRASTGAWSSQLINPVSGTKKYVTSLMWGMQISSGAIGALLLADLLVAAGNITLNSNVAQTINTTALTRYTGGEGVMMILVITSAAGATAQNLTVNKYHNQAGTANQTTAAIAMTASAVANRLEPETIGPFIQLADGDYGVQSVEELTFSAANTGTAALHLFKPLAMVGAVYGSGTQQTMHFEKVLSASIEAALEVHTASSVLGCLTAYDFAMSAGGLNVMTTLTTMDG